MIKSHAHIRKEKEAAFFSPSNVHRRTSNRHRVVVQMRGAESVMLCIGTLSALLRGDSHSARETIMRHWERQRTRMIEKEKIVSPLWEQVRIERSERQKNQTTRTKLRNLLNKSSESERELTKYRKHVRNGLQEKGLHQRQKCHFQHRWIQLHHW